MACRSSEATVAAAAISTFSAPAAASTPAATATRAEAVGRGHHQSALWRSDFIWSAQSVNTKHILNPYPTFVILYHFQDSVEVGQELDQEGETCST